MPELTIVTFDAEFAADDSGRTIGGLAVPFGATSKPTMWRGVPRRHRFEFGAFTRTIAERGAKVRLFGEHDTGRFPIGRAATLAEETGGLRVAFEVADTNAGNDALQLVKGGFVTGFSAGIDAVGFRDEDGVIVHTETALREISLVSSPAFEDALAAAFGTEPATPQLPVEHARRLLSLREKDIR